MTDTPFILVRESTDFEINLTVKNGETGGVYPLSGTLSVRFWKTGAASHFLDCTVANGKIAVNTTTGVVTFNVPAASLAGIADNYGTIAIMRTDAGLDSVVSPIPCRYVTADSAGVVSNQIVNVNNTTVTVTGDAASVLTAVEEAAAAVKFNWRGAYSGATAYVARDMVQNNGSSWLCIAATTGNAPPTLPTTSNTWWELHSAKGDTGATGAASTVPGPTGSLTVGSPATVSFASGDMLLISDASDSGNVKKLDPIGIGSVPTASSITVYVSPDSTTATANGDAYYGGSGIQAAIDSLAGYRATGSATLNVVLRNGTYTVSSLVLRHPQPNVLKLVAQNLPTLPSASAYTSDAAANRTVMLAAWNVKILGSMSIPDGVVINQIKGVLFDNTYIYGQFLNIYGVLTDFASCGIDAGYQGINVNGGVIYGSSDPVHIVSAGMLLDNAARVTLTSPIVRYCSIATTPVQITNASCLNLNGGSVTGQTGCISVYGKSLCRANGTVITAISGVPIAVGEQSLFSMITGSLIANDNYAANVSNGSYADLNSVVLNDTASATPRTLYAYGGSIIYHGTSCTAGTRTPVLSPTSGVIGNANSQNL